METAQAAQSAVRVEIDATRIATVWLDLPGKSVNTMSVKMWRDLGAALAQLERDQSRGAIFASGKPKSFVAGADLFEMRAMDDAQLDHYLADGQRIYNRLEALPFPTVAAINGDCLGGGMELALACKLRVAIDEPSIQIGLPEAKLGLIPGWGGTVRLPRLIGLDRALPLLLAWKTLAPAAAREAGLVDDVVPRERLIDAARALVDGGHHARTASAPSKHELQAILERAVIDTRARSGDHLPAPLRLIEVVHTSYVDGTDAGFAAERRGLIDLRNSDAGKNLMRLFFLRTGAKKAAAEQAGGKPRDVKSAAVIGGGTMGAGIAAALVRAGIPTHVIEVDAAAAAAADSRIKKMIGGDSSAFHATTSWDDLSDVDLVIEAVIEQMPAKLEVFSRLDRVVRPDAILASNTSSLSVTEMAPGTNRPARVVGLHFFNPVAKMPLVEVVRTKHADADAVATAVSVATKLGKMPVIVSDSPGFLVNRVLFPYLAEALRMADKGHAIQSIDRAIKQWGMPMGPFELMDEIGLDVTAMILRALRPKLGAQFEYPPLLDLALAQGLRGKKSGEGFYRYTEKPSPNERFPGASSMSGTVPPEDVQSRLLEKMADEARLVMQERVVDSPDAIDLATVLGLGFAPFRGGLATFAGLRS